jgi:hypothetical protein
VFEEDEDLQLVAERVIVSTCRAVPGRLVNHGEVRASTGRRSARLAR